MSFVSRQGRIDLRVPVIFSLGGEQVAAETRNVGLGGVFVATREPPPIGERVSLHLTLPDWDESHFVFGEVRWARGSDEGLYPLGGSGMGVRFVKLSLHVAAVLDSLIRSHTLGR